MAAGWTDRLRHSSGTVAAGSGRRPNGLARHCLSIDMSTFTAEVDNGRGRAGATGDPVDREYDDLRHGCEPAAPGDQPIRHAAARYDLTAVGFAAFSFP